VLLPLLLLPLPPLLPSAPSEVDDVLLLLLLLLLSADELPLPLMRTTVSTLPCKCEHISKLLVRQADEIYCKKHVFD
jgi:hypothetical protein